MEIFPKLTEVGSNWFLNNGLAPISSFPEGSVSPRSFFAIAVSPDGAITLKVVGMGTDPIWAVTVAEPGFKLAVKVVPEPLVELIVRPPERVQVVIPGIPLKYTTSPMPIVVRSSSGFPTAVHDVR